MEAVDSAYWLEGSAYWIRNAPSHHIRNEFYRWMVAEYAAMIAEIHPALRKTEPRNRAYAVVSLVLGAWITHGRGSSWSKQFSAQQQREVLIQAAMSIVKA